MKTKLKSIVAAALCAVGLSAFAVDSVTYLDWDEVNHKLTNATCTAYETVTASSPTTFGAGKTYVVKGAVTRSAAIAVKGVEPSPTRFILCDGAKLTASKGLVVSANYALVICAQEGGTGALEAKGGTDGAGIGGGSTTKVAGGTITINGGVVTATGGSSGGAGIGGSSGKAGGKVTINGGTVTATGGQQAAGIGGGFEGAGGTVTINGGTVTATGDKYGAGIGGGNLADFVAVTVNGGVVTANGGESAAGIGSGGRQEIGGTGGVVTINGGKVVANGGAWGAGIGGGNRCHNGTVTINGGAVTATTSGGAAGIGGGWGGNGGTVAINGGSVTATSGEQYGVAIGGGDTAAEPGTVTFGADFAYGVLADGLFKDQAAFSGNHTAKSVTTPAAGVKIPAPTGYSYVVSNETAQLAATLADGTNTYGVVTGATVKVYFTLGEGYEWKVPPTENPMVVAGLWTDTIVKLDQLPTAERKLTVANVTTATHWPWDGKIDVTCDLTGAGKVQLSAALTTNGVTVCTATAANLTGAVVDLDAVGGETNGVTFVWDAKADCPAGFNSTDTKVKVTAEKVKSLPAGALKGEFSVSADKKVHFSQGNLVATIDATGAPTAWKFAANQYDCIGNATANNSIGSTAGDVDLFGWSTDAASNNWGIHTKDEATTGYTDGDFNDWGKNIGDGNTWRTLTTAEWQYLFNTRTVNGGKGAGKSYSLNITYGGKMGVVLYPDDYTGSVLSGTVDSLPEGVVFLPAAGYRDGSYVDEVGDRGYYWSSAANGSGYAYDMIFSSGGVSFDSEKRSYGDSVRLVTEVK